MTAELTPFSQQIAYMNQGCTDADLAERLAEVVKAVVETGKQGTISLQLKVSVQKTKAGEQIKLTPIVSSKKPEMPIGDTIMFPTYDGDLLREDPNQRSLDLKAVQPEQASSLKTVNS